MPENNEQLPDELKGSSGTNAVSGRVGVMGELYGFLWQRKLYWLLPMIIVLAVFALIVIAGGSSVLAPFIYTLGV